MGTDDQDIEKGRKIRVDCTVVESNIHDPYDSELLVDGTRVLGRILATAKAELPGIVFTFADHLRRAKHRNLEIMNAKNVFSVESTSIMSVDLRVFSFDIEAPLLKTFRQNLPRNRWFNVSSCDT